MACEEKCFTFTWKVENASYCLQEMGACIPSPKFVVDAIGETKWHLSLYPRGESYENYIGFYLFKDEDCKGARELKYELTFIAEDGSTLTFWNAVINDFLKMKGQGFSLFKSRDEVFNTKKTTFLPQDTLTARCRIWKSDGCMPEDVRCFARTRIGVQKRTFVWKVKKFSTLVSGGKYAYAIKSVSDDKQLMSINLYLTEESGSEEVISFELTPQDRAPKFSTLQLSLIDSSGNKVLCNQEEVWFNDQSKSKEIKFFFSKNKLMQMKSLYLPNDVLSLHWKWAFSKGVVSNEIEDFQYECTSSDCKLSNAQNMKNQKMMPLSNSLTHLKPLYDENFLCDVKLKTSTRTFNAHKIILSSSSPVFKAMFSNDMKENGSNCVNIEDSSDDTISRMLHFIYTASLEDLTLESASYLYIAADKYAILSLKHMCSSYMKNNLTPKNACEILLLFDFHADSVLKSAVQNYILKHIKCIVNSDEWKILIETNAKLAAETVCLQYK